jgi:hypothetical protein
MSDNNPSAADPFGHTADELVEAFRQGLRPSVEELARRYPEHADEIREMLPALVLIEKAKSAAAPGQRRPGPVSAAPAPLSLLGDYQILREVGRGGMGVVYEAQQLSLGRHVAIKVLPSHAMLDPRHLGRFQREARAAAKLHHANIVPVYGVGEHDGLDYFVMKFIPGLGLDVVLRGNNVFFHAVSWHPDGARLAAASSDGQIWVWDATRGFERDTTPRALPYIDRKVASGTARGEDLLAFAQTAFDQKKFASAIQLWSEAMENDAKRFDGRPRQQRYNAARAAALMAAGQSQDGPPLDDAAKARLRRQALDWLKAELVAWGQLLEPDLRQARPFIVSNLSHWQQDSDLASIRDAAALAKLPAGEQKAFAQLWADVAALLKKASTSRVAPAE